jgi:glucan-binding YG repeat protein
MRKQTKVVAVASAAALLAIGASMTSFAATGWVEEDGTWYFYDNDGNRVEDAWKKSGDNWYWLDAEDGGAMAVEKLVEDDDDTYYVDANGVMVRNTWVKVVNEEQDEDDDPAEYHYYYMQSNGKAYKAPDNNTTTRFRTIDGKRYAFDDEGKMLYGWVKDGERQTDDDGWEDAVYYLGNWDDGAMKTGWQKIYVHDEDEDDDLEYWFNFKSNGKKRFNDTYNEIKEEKINGKRYGFDKRGVMTYEWTLATKGTTGASWASTSSWRYFNNIEDGARVTKGWFKVVAPHEDNDNVFKSGYSGDTFATTDADEENERWYYSDGDGKVVSGQIRKIKGKYYGFRPEDDGNGKGGAMLNGLVLMVVNQGTGEIVKVVDDGVDADELDDLMDWDQTSTIYQDYLAAVDDLDWSAGEDISLYYFGNDEDADGSMKTGATTVTIDGNTYNFMFRKSGGVGTKGFGLTGVDDNKYIYNLGCRIKADSDDKYQVVEVVTPYNMTTNKPESADIQAGNVSVYKRPSIDFKNIASNNTVVNDSDETVSYMDVSRWHGHYTNNAGVNLYARYYLVNTSGNIQKSKVAAKDGDDWYFYVKNRAVMLYTNNKNLDKKSTTNISEKWDTAGAYVSRPNISN